ncbi:hypothetical protein AAFP30_26320 [Gordonia sp. CPCC 205515]|uniref:hypothetical protein n=1 Tax=Gordonia sp. CPCC 205515 TaxID=3140791 RepID=UPI003AF3C4DE
MLASVVFVPSAPLLVPALCGPMAHDAEPIRTATLAAAAELASAARSWVAIGAGDGSATSFDAGSVGTFAGYGVDVPVTLSAGSPIPAVRGASRAAPIPEVRGASRATKGRAPLPLSMLIAGWLREQVAVESVRPIVVNPDATAEDCARIGVTLATELDADPDPVGVLVVGDGAISLTAKSPGGGLRPTAVELQARLDAAIGDADLGALAELDVAECATEGVGGRAAWQVAAALCAGRDVKSEKLCTEAPFGVGYIVARWTPQ